MDPVGPLAIEGLMLELLVETSRRRENVSERKPPHWLRQARDLVNDRFAENLSLDDIAATVKVHPSHLARVFRQQYGCSIGEYTRQLRLDHARHELSTSEASLLEIAVASGFSDQSHFSKAFKRHTGLTPTEFRRIFGWR
jgi:AraC family transcriptional regulator